MSFSLAQRKELKETSTLSKAFPYMGRMQFEIAETADFKGFGMAREACALKGERCVFYEMDINLEVFNLETDFFGDLHCSSRWTDMLCDAHAQYGDYSELENCPMWGIWVKEGRE